MPPRRARVRQWTTPHQPSLTAGLATDVVRRRTAPLLERAFLRQRVIVLGRATERPAFTPRDRGLLILLASRLRTRANALPIVRPATLLRWHREGFRLFWRRKSAPRTRPSPLPTATVERIKGMARDNPLWGAERIRGELLKRDIRVSKRTIQQYLRQAPRSRPVGQSWACDFLQATDLLFRPLYAFFVIALGTRRVVHVGVTRHPTDARVSRQLREATPLAERPTYRIRDNDSKYGPTCSRTAEASGSTELRTAYLTPRQNATRGYVASFNTAATPGPATAHPRPSGDACASILGKGEVRAVPVLGGLHHTYPRAA